MGEPLRYADPRATRSGEPDAQGARPCPLGSQALPATPSLNRAERRSLPTVAEGLASLGFTGSFVAALSVVMFLACVVCSATAGPSVAPTSARDDGPTLPIESFLAERQPDGPQTELVSDMAVAYPVSNPGLRTGTPGGSASMPAAYAAWLTQPIALIGDDANSRRWLTQQGDALNALGASILVVQVKSLERMRALRAHRPELAMAPARVPELVAVLRGIAAAVYPLVILADGSVQQDVRSRIPARLPQIVGDRP